MDGSARLTGPVAGPPGIIMTGFDLGQVGYTLEEFFLEATDEMVAVAAAAYPGTGGSALGLDVDCHPDERRQSGDAWHRITSRPGAVLS